MVSEADEGATDTKSARRTGARSKKIKRPRPPLPENEDQIDAPDKLTLVVLGFMGVVTLVLWGFARGGCNYHPPRETRRPRAVKTEELAREPKDAALEMQQRLLQLDFDGAAELASGSALVAVQKAKADCDAKSQECAMERKHMEKGVASTPALLERQATSAVVRVTTEMPGGKKDVSLLKLERSGSLWKVMSREPDDGTFHATPSGAEGAFGSQLMPPPSLSGAPSGSVVPLGSAVPIPLTSGSSRHTVMLKPPPGHPPVPPAPAPASSP